MKKNKLTVLFDANPMANGQKSGVGQYTYRLIDALARNFPDDIELVGHYFNFLGRKHPQFPLYPNIHYKSSRLLPGKVLSLLRRVGLQLPFDLLVKSKGDIALFPNFVSLPLMQPAKIVAVIHDLSFEEFPEYLQRPNRNFLKRFVPGTAKKADLIIAISESTKSKIIDYYQVAPEKIAIVNPAINHEEYYPRPKNEIDKIRQKYQLPARYILYTGTLEPRKNIEGIMRAYANLDNEISDEYSIVLAGGKGWLDEHITSTFNELTSAGADIIRAGYVPSEDLPALYSGASLFVFPSFYEGFGMPPLEAMACGVPVITSDNSSLPEVVGQAAIKIKAEDTAAITKAMARLLSDSKLVAELRKKGLAQAKKFSWDKSAEDLIAVLNELAR